jgi:hypothetical protein
VNKVFGSDKGVSFRLRIWHMQRGTAKRNGSVHRQDSISECGQYMLMQPGAEKCALGSVAAFHQEDSQFEFEHRDAGEEQARGGCRSCP